MTSLPRSPGIYIITCLPTGMIYVGSARNLRARSQKHFSALRNQQHPNRHLQNAYNKHGDTAFSFAILELVMPWSLIDREQYWLDKIQPFGRHGFNIEQQAGITFLGRRHSPETRAKISAAKKGKIQSPETRAKRSAALKGNQNGLGHKHTDEARQKMSIAHKGQQHSLGYKHSEETRAKMSAAGKGRTKSPEHQAKITAALPRKPLSPEHRAKLSVSIKAAKAKKKQAAIEEKGNE